MSERRLYLTLGFAVLLLVAVVWGALTLGHNTPKSCPDGSFPVYSMSGKDPGQHGWFCWRRAS